MSPNAIAKKIKFQTAAGIKTIQARTVSMLDYLAFGDFSKSLSATKLNDHHALWAIAVVALSRVGDHYAFVATKRYACSNSNHLRFLSFLILSIYTDSKGMSTNNL
jgi:hypothetical protein